MIYLLRHGEIAQSQPRRFVGQQDKPLTDRGRAQAAWWRERLAGRDFQGVYSSDLIRCRQTAAAVARGGPYQLVPELREISLGAWEGLTVAQVQERFPGEYERRGADIAHHRPSGGESFAELAGRVLPAFERLSAGLERDILVVAHAGVSRVILCHALGLDLAHLFRLELDYGGLCLLERRGQAWLVHGVNLRPQVD
ncbi:MAG: histidine phosphatase family protein [Desulfarculus sp.]|nr:MAG: histidine phosphatase family protein [Desulfarculus sp.]